MVAEAFPLGLLGLRHHLLHHPEPAPEPGVSS